MKLRAQSEKPGIHYEHPKWRIVTRPDIEVIDFEKIPGLKETFYLQGYYCEVIKGKSILLITRRKLEGMVMNSHWSTEEIVNWLYKKLDKYADKHPDLTDAQVLEEIMETLL